MHLASGTPWVPVKAEQWYSVRPPGFVWYATLHIGPVPIVRALDMYLTGEGRMLIKAASLVTVADAKGKEFDQGEMVRYLSEMIWFPSAFLEDNVSFEAVDARSARVILTHGGRTASGTLFFDREGRLTEFVARRYDGTNLETWSVSIAAYGQFEGLNLPVRGRQHGSWPRVIRSTSTSPSQSSTMSADQASPCSMIANGCPRPHDLQLPRNGNPERLPWRSRPSPHSGGSFGGVRVGPPNDWSWWAKSPKQLRW